MKKIYSSLKICLLLILSTILSEIKAQATYTFNYTGAVQTVNLQAGSYNIEAWGANGGGSQGGKGGYSTGTLTLSSATTLYVVVGGPGGTGGIPADINGGYN